MVSFNLRKNFIIKATIRVRAAIVMFLLLFILAAGTFIYWQPRVYLVVLLLLVTAVMIYLKKADPELLQHRLESQVKHQEQNFLGKIVTFTILLFFIIPGFDHRFGWSNVPVALVVIADFLIIVNYSFIELDLRENGYAVRIVIVEEEHKVITSGPYSIIRYLMYLSMLIFFLFTPLALGSWWVDFLPRSSFPC